MSLQNAAKTETMSFGRPVRRRRVIISLTPLIDVVFILLIFFMLASSFLEWRAIDLDPPITASDTPSPEASVVVEITPDGLLLNGESIPLSILAQAVEKSRQNVDTPILITPIKGVSVQQTVDVLDTLKAANIEGLSLTKPQRGAK